MDGTGNKRRRYVLPACCLIVALAGVAIAYRMGRSASFGGDIGREAAKAAALGHAGIAESALTRYEIALDESGKVPVYEVEFTADGCAYDYAVSAADGSIVGFSREAEGDPSLSQPAQDRPAAPAAPAAPDTPTADTTAAPAAPSAPAAGTITEGQAKEIALNHAGVTAEGVSGYRWELDYDDGVAVYELEFRAGGYEYDYEISAADGSVLKCEKETDGSVPTAAANTTAAAAGDYIGEARAWEIAYGHAGVTAGSVTHCGIALDHERHHSHGHHYEANCCVYEVDFHAGGYEYEYKIDALNGTILDFQQETDD